MCAFLSMFAGRWVTQWSDANASTCPDEGVQGYNGGSRGPSFRRQSKRSEWMKRPFEVTFLGGLFIIAGTVGLVYHLSDRPVDHWIILIAAVRILAIVGGVFLLLGRGW